MGSGVEKSVGRVLRVEWDQDTNEVRLVLEITDEKFKERVLHSRDLKDLLTIKKREVVIVDG